MSLQEKILSNDSYDKAFNNANTALTVAALCLKKCDVYIVDVDKFKKACDDVATILSNYNKKEKLLNFYLWVRSKLTQLFLKENTRLGVKMNCHAGANSMDITIKELCKDLNGDKVIPFLVNLTYDTNKTHPTLQK